LSRGRWAFRPPPRIHIRHYQPCLSLADFVVRDWIYFDFALYFYAPISTTVLSPTGFLAGGLVFVISFLGSYFILFHFALRFVFYILFFSCYFARYNSCDTLCSYIFQYSPPLVYLFLFFAIASMSQQYVINPIKVVSMLLAPD